jgi:Domain of unknown function (DUF6894)
VRYHFHVDDGIPNNDVEGTDVADLDSVEQEACRLAGHLLIEGCRSFWRNPNWRVRVTDEAGNPVLTMMLMGVRGSVTDAH